MAPVQPSLDCWRPSKRLRQLESIAGRGLLLGFSGKACAAPAAHCVTLAARCAGDASWRVVYRSEAVCSPNPEWQPLVWSEEQLLGEDPLLDGGDGSSGSASDGGQGGGGVQVLLALHALDPQQAQQAPQQEVGIEQRQDAAPQQEAAGEGPADWLEGPAISGAAGNKGREAAAGARGGGTAAAAGAQSPVADATRPLLLAAAERPAFELPPSPQEAAAEKAAAEETAWAAADEAQTAGAACREGVKQAVPLTSCSSDAVEPQQPGTPSSRQVANGTAAAAPAAGSAPGKGEQHDQREAQQRSQPGSPLSQQQQQQQQQQQRVEKQQSEQQQQRRVEQQDGLRPGGSGQGYPAHQQAATQQSGVGEAAAAAAGEVAHPEGALGLGGGAANGSSAAADAAPSRRGSSSSGSNGNDSTSPAAPSPAQAAALPAATDWQEALAAALSSTGYCPGRLVAAWKLDSLEELFPAGADLALLHQPLQPNTLVLQFPDGCYLCPPPLPQQAPVAAAASTLRRALHGSGASQLGDEQAVAAAASAAAVAPLPARRGLASLLVSKLLRSTTNLQLEGGSVQGSAGAELVMEGDAAGLSDAESDAGSDLTASTTLSRVTTTTAASELPASAGAAARGAAGGIGIGGGSWQLVAADAGRPHGQQAQMLTLAATQQCITSLAALQGRLRDISGRSQALQSSLAERLASHQQRQQQQAALASLTQEAQRCRQRASEVRRQHLEVQAAAAAATRQAAVRSQALVTTLKVMQAADRRVGDAEAALEGEEGRGSLVAALRELVARRCQMVCQLGAIFHLGPTAVSIPEAPPGGFLEDRLEQQWAGAAPSSGSGFGYASLSLSGTPLQQQQQQPLDGMAGFGRGGLGGAVDSPSKYRQEMRLSIGGLEIHPWVWRKAFDEAGGYDSDAAEDRTAGVALGHVAQVVDRLGAYLGVPLRYPLALRGSRSAVVDCQPPLGTWAPDAETEAGARRPLFGGWHGSGAETGEREGGGARPVEYPLYCDSNRERARFAVGVFLLNKDVIQLLQAHGISAAGPNHLLHNLYKLLLAAQSALPHLPPTLAPR